MLQSALARIIFRASVKLNLWADQAGFLLLQMPLGCMLDDVAAIVICDLVHHAYLSMRVKTDASDQEKQLALTEAAIAARLRDLCSRSQDLKRRIWQALGVHQDPNVYACSSLLHPSAL